MATTASINDRTIETLAMVLTMDEGMSNDDPDRHIVRNLKRMAHRCIEDGLNQAMELAFQSRDVRETFKKLKD